jgi:UDP-N-acetylmuramoylalanine--D-glutamate ligase
MDDAFAAALANAAPGDTILLSPAATSFGIFTNEYDRGEQFKKKFEQLV